MTAEPTAVALDDTPARDGEPSGPPSGVAPVSAEERISSVDVLRGVAVLGILLMNILSFGMAWRGPDADLAPGAGATRADLLFWGVSHVLFEGKMRAIFSLLFGAGVVLLTSRLERRGGGLRVADIYYRRTLWLIAFGLVHAYFIWDGDILFDYGVAGLALFAFRNARPSALIAAGVVLLLIPVLKQHGDVVESRALRVRAEAADRLAAAGRPLTEDQREDRKKWEEELKNLRPPAEKVAKQVAEHRGGYLKLFASRAKEVRHNQPVFFYDITVFDVGGMMLIGMGLMRLGVLSAQCGYGVYAALMALGYGVGVPLNLYTGYRVWATGFDAFTYQDVGLWYSPARLAVAMGNVGLILALYKAGVARRLMARLAAVGRMALTNYLATSVACVLIFDGYGLGLYDRLRRYQLLAVVAAVWAAQLALSPVWLRHFRYGPMEWLWRSLTYWRLQPMRPTPNPQVPPPIS